MTTQPSSSAVATDQRHLRRQRLVQDLFAATFSEQDGKISESISNIANRLPFDQELHPEVLTILDNLEEIDKKLKEHAAERPLSEINRVDLAILRVIYWESVTNNTPIKVLIDEAVELAKELGSESSSRFVNGVLGKLLVEKK